MKHQTDGNTIRYDHEAELRQLLRLYPLALARLSSPPTFQFSQREQQTNNIRRSIEEWLEVKLTVERLLDSLSQRERLAVRGYYFQGDRQVEVARSLGISQSRLSRILSTARGRLLCFYLKHHVGIISQPSQSVKEGAGNSVL